MTWFEAHFLIGTASALAFLCAVLLLRQRRTPQSAVAWLLFFILLPYIAVPLFLMLGFRKRGKRYPEAQFRRQRRELTGRGPPLANFLCRSGCPPPSEGNSFTLIDHGSIAFEHVMSTISQARTAIGAGFYLISDDSVGAAFVNTLADKATEGVRVRLNIDRLGGWSRPRSAIRRLIAAGGKVHYASPFLHAPDNGHINLRNHRKNLIIDAETVIAGGMNIGRDYMSETGAGCWIDASYIVRGPIVLDHADIFESDWPTRLAMSRATTTPDRGGALLQFAVSGPDTRYDAIHDGLVFAVHNARQRIWIVSPYFVPTDELMTALRLAARRGVDVAVIVPLRSNHPLTDIARGSFVRQLADDACRILYHSRMVHAKCGIIDDMAWVGSANFDIRSMLLNFEQALFIYDGASVTKMADYFLKLTAGCEIRRHPDGMLRRTAEALFRLTSPVM